MLFQLSYTTVMLKAKGLKDQGELHKMASVLKGKRRSTEQSKQCSLRFEMQIVVRYLIQLGLKYLKEHVFGQRPQRVDDLCFHTYGEFSPPLSSP